MRPDELKIDQRMLEGGGGCRPFQQRLDREKGNHEKLQKEKNHQEMSLIIDNQSH